MKIYYCGNHGSTLLLQKKVTAEQVCLTKPTDRASLNYVIHSFIFRNISSIWGQQTEESARKKKTLRTVNVSLSWWDIGSFTRLLKACMRIKYNICQTAVARRKEGAPQLNDQVNRVHLCVLSCSPPLHRCISTHSMSIQTLELRLLSQSLHCWSFLISPKPVLAIPKWLNSKDFGWIQARHLTHLLNMQVSYRN